MPILIILLIFVGIYLCIDIPFKIKDAKKKKVEFEKHQKDEERTIKIKNTHAYNHTIKLCRQHITRRLNEIESDISTKEPSECNLYGLTIKIDNEIKIYDDYLTYNSIHSQSLETIYLSDFYISLDHESKHLFMLALYNDLNDYYKNEHRLDITKCSLNQEYGIRIVFDNFLKSKTEKL